MNLSKLSSQDLKNIEAVLNKVVAREIGPFRKEFLHHRSEFVGLRGDFVELKNEFKEHRSEFVGLKNEFKDLRIEFVGLRGEFVEYKKTSMELLESIFDDLQGKHQEMRELKSEVSRLEKIQPIIT